MLDPVKISVSVGEESSGKLIDAVIDAFSPTAELLGLLGDSIRLARVSVAAKVTRKAKQIADENGLVLIAPPLKFLVPFYEKASLEEHENDALIDMWARLLTSASTKRTDRHNRFVSILAELGKIQAELLDQIANNFEGTITEIDESALFYNLQSAHLSTIISQVETSDADEAIEEILELVSKPGVCLEIAEIDPNDKPGELIQFLDDLYSDPIAVELQILASLGLIAWSNTGFVECRAGHIHVSLYCFTDLGLEFWKACRMGIGDDA